MTAATDAFDDGPFAALFARDALDPAVAVVDGFGLHVRVERGHLHVTDGIGDTRRTRRYGRTERTLRRLIVLGHTGSITLEALRWCADLGVALVQLDTDGRVLTLSMAPGRDDARLRRAQAAAPDSPTGLLITRQLLGAKVSGQAHVLARLLNLSIPAANLTGLAERLGEAVSIPACLDLEAAAANTYFAGWAAHVEVRFTNRDQPRVPAHWRTFAARNSPISTGKGPGKAADPVNAMLNYAYAVAEAECRIALVAVGLDPGLGIAHTDRHARDSLALDLLEAVRPAVDTHVLTLLATRHLRAADFHETADGNCRILAPLTHQIAEAAPTWAQTIAVHAEQICHTLAAAATGKIRISTPLTGANRRAAQTIPSAVRKARRASQQALGLPRCRDCGIDLLTADRQLCDVCWPVRRRQQATERAERGRQARAALAAAGQDPTQTAAAKAKRTAGRAERLRAEQAWTAAHPDASTDPAYFVTAILPTLAAVSLADLARATGLSVAACSRIRAGNLQPHPRHWQPLASLATSDTVH